MQVSEALQSSTRAIKENQISIAEVDQCLQELDENFDSLKRLDNALGKNSTSDFCFIFLSEPCGHAQSFIEQ